MGKRQESKWPARFHVGLDQATGARIRAASDRYSVAESVILRRAVDIGLDRAIDAIRKQAGSRAARDAGT